MLEPKNLVKNWYREVWRDLGIIQVERGGIGHAVASAKNTTPGRLSRSLAAQSSGSHTLRSWTMLSMHIVLVSALYIVVVPSNKFPSLY